MWNICVYDDKEVYIISQNLNYKELFSKLFRDVSTSFKGSIINLPRIAQKTNLQLCQTKL
jgi:hypothetical protein